MKSLIFFNFSYIFFLFFAILDDFFRIGTLWLFCSNFKKSCNKNWKKINIQYRLLQFLYILGWVQALKLENKTRIYCFLLPDSISSPALQKGKLHSLRKGLQRLLHLPSIVIKKYPCLFDWNMNHLNK